MHDRTSTDLDTDTAAHPDALGRLIGGIQRLLVPLFSLFFLAFALLYAGSAVIELIRPIVASGDLIEGLVKGLHMGVVALAVYELALIVYEENGIGERPEDTVQRIRRGVVRFASVVIIALILESLIMVIKYSQKDLAGFLYYPAALVVAAALLLLALGAFTRLTRTSPAAGH